MASDRRDVVQMRIFARNPGEKYQSDPESAPLHSMLRALRVHDLQEHYVSLQPGLHVKSMGVLLRPFVLKFS